jgi:hypothetical protein
MRKLLALLLLVNGGMFVWNLWDTLLFAQRPPETNPLGIDYLRVNINPTPIPPLVNINPPGEAPRVEVVRMPEIVVPPAGCDDAANFETAVGQAVTGPILLSYLNPGQVGAITFVDTANNSYRVTLGTSPLVGSGIYLRSGQRLEFGTAVMYSGCRPAQ